MQRVTLVNPPNHQSDLFDLAPPLGLMVLAGIARKVGWQPQILDLALPNATTDDALVFYEHALRQIIITDPTVVCFTSMGVNTHIALELARRVKEVDQSVVTCVGGVHFTSIAADVNRECPWIDTVVLGEGERGFERVLTQLESRRSSDSLPALVMESPSSNELAHPHGSYDLVPLEDYFHVNPRRVLNYEGGRGCIFKCSFCYSPSHYESVRDAPPDQVVSDWTQLAERGARHVFMVQDNFTNSPKNAVAVCDALAAANLPITWNGYATLPQLNSEVAKALGRSKCRQIYLGVDAVAETQRVAFNKRFYRGSEHLQNRLRELKNEGVEPTCAFMLDLFNYSEDEAEVVFRVAAECAAVGASIRLNTFTRYPGSELGVTRNGAAHYSDAKVRIMLDCPEVVRENPFARSMPSAFPFHATEVKDEAVWVDRLRMVWLAQRLIQSYPDDFTQMAANPDNRIVHGIHRLARAEDLSDLLGSGKVPGVQEPATEIY